MTTRRTILKAALVSGAATVFSGSLGAMSAFAAGLPTRRSLHGMALDDPDLETYRHFVELMLAKKQSASVSWLGYSLQHGNYNTGAYKYCPHGDWYFLPWHRGFVCMYENAARAFTGNKNFAMPYWDWSVDRDFPAAFSDKTYKGKPNPLYVEGRTLTNPKHWPLPDSVVGPKVMEEIYQETDFQLFGTSKNPDQDNLDMSWVVAGGGVQGTLERTPHNTIHNWIGKYMPSAGSPRDPIFMMHHSNIDRIWAVWNALGRSNTSGMDATTQNLWLEMNFKDNYIKPNGQLYSLVVKDVQSTAALGYTYENLPQADNKVPDAQRSKHLLSLFGTGADIQNLDNVRILPTPNQEAATLQKPLVKQSRISKPLRDMVVNKAAANARTPEVFALIKDIEVSPAIEAVRVFVNMENANTDTPDTDPHFVTMIGFLEHSGHGGTNHGKMPPSALVELTATLRGLAASGMLTDNSISVALVPVLREGVAADQTAKVVPATIEIAVI